MKRIALGFVLGLAGLFVLADIAAACTYECVWVTPTCRRCQDIGVYNAQTCQNTVGPCGCFYVRNLCDPVAAVKAEQDQQLAAVGVVPAEQSVCAGQQDAGVAAIFAAQ